MLNIYDIILNFCDNNRVYEFFEWNKKDSIEHIKKIPMIKVSQKVMNDVLKTSFVVDKKLLSDIYKKTEIYHDDGLSKIEYGLLITDGSKIIAVEFNDLGKSIYKSYLLIDEEEEILELCGEVDIYDLKYRIIKKYTPNNSFLTREEEFKKNYLLKEIKSLYKRKKYENINYLYDEIYPKEKKTIEEKYSLIINDISDNYSKIHNNIYKILRLTNKKKTTN